jgi:hypothetical protein
VPIDPKERWSIEAFLRGPRPIVGLRRKVRDPEQDEEVTEELNIEPELKPPTHPDYDHEPEVMMLARQVLGAPEIVEVRRRQLEAIARHGTPKDQLLAKVVLALPKKR